MLVSGVTKFFSFKREAKISEACFGEFRTLTKSFSSFLLNGWGSEKLNF